MPHPPHWSYYMSLEDDLIETDRYVEIGEDNLDTYSTQFTRLLLAAASEVDVVAKTLCGQIDPHGKHKNIDDYRKVIAPNFPAISTVQMGIEWNPLRIKPWAPWTGANPSSPDWWRAYNGVKHERNANFKSGNLRNALGAIAGLYCLVRHLEEDRGRPRPERLLKIVPSHECTANHRGRRGRPTGPRCGRDRQRLEPQRHPLVVAASAGRVRRNQEAWWNRPF